MATITKRVERAVEPSKRYQIFKSSGNNDDGDPIGVNDVFMIETSLGRPARMIQITADAYASNFSIRLNSRIVQYQTLKPIDDSPPIPDLPNPIISTDTSMEPIVIGAGESLVLNEMVPVSDIQIVSLDAGSFEILVS